MKTKFLIAILAVLAVLVSLLVVSAALAAKPESKPKNTMVIPPKAVEVAPNVFYLGKAIDKGRIVEGYAIINYKKGYGKPGTACGNGICEPGENAVKCPVDCGSAEPDTSSCYGFLAKGAKWKSVEPYIIDPNNLEGLSSSFISDNLASDISKWEAAAGVEILGAKINGIVDGADTVSPDDKNEVYFADIKEPGAIAITIVWGYFGGPPFARELVEWDQVYDDADFDWSATGEAGKMDFENIATHELGHSVGLDDLYTSSCSEVTMYGYADYGEIKKRTLETPDIIGLQTLYG